MLSEKKLFLFDIDGTVALGDVLLPGAAEFFQEIKERGGQFVPALTADTDPQGGALRSPLQPVEPAQGDRVVAGHRIHGGPPGNRP